MIYRPLLTLLLLLSTAFTGAVAPTSLGEIAELGLPRSRNSLCALRDTYGFLWVGTATGLACYDGNGEAMCHSASGVMEGTQGMRITALAQLGDDIWFGGTPGLYRFSRHNNRVRPFPYKTKYGVPVSSEVRKIVDVGSNRVWILTQGQGLFIFNTADSTLCQNSRHGAFYYDMAIGADHRVYTVEMEGKINIFTPAGDMVAAVDIPGYVKDKNPIHIAAVGDHLWVSANRKLYRFYPDSRKITVVPTPTDLGRVSALLGGTDATTLLIGTENGLWTLDTASSLFKKYHSETGHLNDYNILQLSYDNDGSLGLVTASAGVAKMRKTRSEIRQVRIPHPVGQPRGVTAICPNSSGNSLWIGSENGLYLFNPKETEIKLPSSVLTLPAISHLLLADGKLLVGTRNQGLFVADSTLSVAQHYTYDPQVPYTLLSNDVRKMFHTSRGEYFVLTSWGICHFNPDSGNFFTMGDIDRAVPLVDICEDAARRLWVASASTALYVRRHADQRFSLFHSQGLKNYPVAFFHLDGAGRFWAVTQGNDIFRFDEEQQDFTLLEVPISADEPLLFLQDDLDGNLWTATTKSLYKIDGDSRLSYYPLPAPLSPRSSSALGTSACRMADGHILFAGDEGLWMFQPQKMHADSGKAKAYVQEISFPYADNDKQQLRDLGFDILLYTRDRIELPHDYNTFTLQLSVARAGDMPPVRYDYMLQGVDKGWIRHAGSQITYNNLPPGSYQFLVRPSVGGGGDTPTQRLTIVILPPWYRSWLAYTIYGLLGVALVWLTAWYMRRRVRRHYFRKMQAQQMARERETYEGKMKFFIDLFHEIRTPLTLISLPLEQLQLELQSGATSQATSQKHIASMRRNLGYLLGIINQMMDIRRSERHATIRIAPQKVDICAFLHDIVERFRHPMEAQGKSIELQLPETQMQVSIDTVKVDTVMMNLIGNAMKYCTHHVVVSLRVAQGDGLLDISVADDGPGVPEDQREHIFDIYYQVEGDDVAATLGTGLGLTYAKLIAKAHGGEIRVGQSATGGAEFILTLPWQSMSQDSALRRAEGLSLQATAEGLQRAEGTSLPATAMQRLRLLLVDDNEELLGMLADVMALTYQVITATDAQKALEALELNPDIDFIISDFMMPGMSGAELCQTVKADVRFSHIPFIILTAKTNTEAKEEGMACGADVYIEKPFTIKQITLQLANMLHTRQLFYARVSQGQQPSTQPTPQQAPYTNEVDAKFLSDLNTYIQENIRDEEFSIDNLATRLNMSRSSFYRKLKAVTGMAPNDYLKNYRLDFAATLLRSGLRVSEAGERSGFTSSSYFAKCFKTRFGLSPKEYAQKLPPESKTQD